MTHTLRGLFASAFLALAVSAGTAAAQAAQAAHPDIAGPSMEASSSAVRAPLAAEQGTPAAALLQQQGGFGRAEALMVVGGAALVAGVVIGDEAGTLIAVGGAVIGLYGLYLWLQPQSAIVGTSIGFGG